LEFDVMEFSIVPAEEPPVCGTRMMLDTNPIVGERRLGPARFWTTREIRVLRELWPDLDALVAALPGRTAAGIYGKGCREGLPIPKKGLARRKYTSNEQIDAFIRRAYVEARDQGDIKRACAQIMRPRWWVAKRALQLGCVVPRYKEPPWTSAELEIVTANAHLSLERLRNRLRLAGFRRTESAILGKMKRLGTDRTEPGRYKCSALAPLFGVNRATVTGWIDKGWLKARGRYSRERHEGEAWWIAEADVRRFVIENAAAVDLRKVDKFWFVDLLARR
jgi:hypothetical protein